MSDVQSLTLAKPDSRPRWGRPQVPQPDLWWVWLAGFLIHTGNAVIEFADGKAVACGKDTVLATLWWLGLHAWRAGDRHRARLLIFVIFAFDLSQVVPPLKLS
jgi:hypothetical protein